MNKTVNINLAGVFFHIDEDAYLKLQRYLEAIKRSFTDSQGRSEIISDIEARISELFNERVKHDKQVIGMKEVDGVITIMGQPEDYLVDDEIFEDEPKAYASRPSSSKKLYRDTDSSYIGGVASGLGHYLGIDAVWIRLLWILLALGSGGTFIFIYILFWILVPEALSTSEKLIMKGEPVNISNIEKKIKKGFDEVSDTVKSIDYQKPVNKIKSSSQTFFDTIGTVIMFFLKLFAKFIGVILIITGAATLIGLIISLFTVGISDAIHIPGLDIVDAANAASTPIWLVSLLSFFAIGIPFFFIFYLGLKILINNLKSIGNIAKFSLLGLWLLSIISLITIGIRQAAEHAYETNVVQKESFAINTLDTFNIKTLGNEDYGYTNFYREGNSFNIMYGENDEKTIYLSDVVMRVRSTPDSIATLRVEKFAEGKSYKEAKKRAENIQYTYSITDNKLLLDNFLTTDFKNKYRDQRITLVLSLPENSNFKLNSNFSSITSHFRNNNNEWTSLNTNTTYKVLNNNVECLDCTGEKDENFKVKINVNDQDSKLKIDDEGVIIKSDDVNITINEDGIKAKADDVKVNINEDGIDIRSDDD